MTGDKDDLFRQDALSATRNDVLGKVSVAVPTARWVYSIMAAAFAVALITYGWFGHYTRRVKVTGEVVPVAGLITLDSTAQGIALRVYAREGDRVKKGQPLLEFNNPLNTSKLGNARDIISAEIMSQRTGLERELETQRQLSDSNSKEIRARLLSQQQQVLALEGQLALQESQAKAYAERMKKIEPLIKHGYVSEYEVQQQQVELLSSRAQGKALTRELLNLRNQLDQTRQELSKVPLELASQETTTRLHLADLRQSQVQNEGQRAWVLRAPEAGLVTSLLVKPGQAVNTGRPLISILPQGSLLEVQLLVPDDAIGFVRRGQRVMLRYHAFPYQEFGQYAGVVSSVSRSALSPDDVESLFGQRVEKSQYRVIIQLDRQVIGNSRSTSLLVPGMTVDADIFLDRRRLVEWVVGPLGGGGMWRAMDGHAATEAKS
jgi:membrane fusion protein